MPSRDELGNSLLECLREVSMLLGHGHTVALEQQDALVKSDAEAITLSYRAQEEVLRRIGESDQRAAAIAAQLAEHAGLDPETTSSESIANYAGFPYTNLIRQELDTISSLAQKVQHANEINHKLLQNGLEIIACCFRTVASDTQPSAYGSDANLPSMQTRTLSLDRRV